MTAIVLFDDARARAFEPFASTRPVSELVAGIATIRDRWKMVLQPSNGVSFAAGARWIRASKLVLVTTHAALDWIGKIPLRPVGNDEQASTVRRCWKPAETIEAHSVVALRRVPCLRAGFAGFASGCQSNVRS